MYWPTIVNPKLDFMRSPLSVDMTSMLCWRPKNIVFDDHMRTGTRRQHARHCQSLSKRLILLEEKLVEPSGIEPLTSCMPCRSDAYI